MSQNVTKCIRFEPPTSEIAPDGMLARSPPGETRCYLLIDEKHLV